MMDGRDGSLKYIRAVRSTHNDAVSGTSSLMRMRVTVVLRTLAVIGAAGIANGVAGAIFFVLLITNILKNITNITLYGDRNIVFRIMVFS